MLTLGSDIKQYMCVAVSKSSLWC